MEQKVALGFAGWEKYKASAGKLFQGGNRPVHVDCGCKS
jgi:hypothetical protein